MTIIVKAGETVEIPGTYGATITNTGTGASSFTVKDGVVETGPRIFCSWTITPAHPLVDAPVIRYA